jgi:hypothetical protein
MLRAYLKAIFKHWAASMTGLAGLLASVIGAVRDSNAVFIWLTGALGIALLFFAGYKAWVEENEAKIRIQAELKRRTTPRSVVQNLTPRVWPAGTGGVSVTGKEYYFDIFNASEADSLDNVRVEVAEIIPDAIGYPNAPLHIRNDSYDTREFSINPGSVRQIDLVTGPVNLPNSQQAMIIAHTVNDHRTAIPYGRYKITVRVSARNAPPVIAVFEAWIEKGELQCTVV